MIQLTAVQHYFEARNLYKIGKYQVAIYDYGKAILLEPNNYKFYAKRGDTYHLLLQYKGQFVIIPKL
ncbi:MAG: tetratricopeptide repeat protein [Rickettsiales endosymbiont of Dermacentor nuttalli]